MKKGIKVIRIIDESLDDVLLISEKDEKKYGLFCGLNSERG